MVFLRDDIYTSSGTSRLYHCWTGNVTKYDASSFYNWEQDDLPLYDLEERDHLLWEQLGHPGSSLPGFMLAVSAGAPASAYECNRNLFPTVSAAVNSLPQIINYPIILEICNFGDLGELNLHNIKFTKRGSLEIINRIFAKAEPFLGPNQVNSAGLDTLTPFAKYDLVSSISGIDFGDPLFGGVMSLGAYGASPRQHFYDTSCLALSAKVFSAIEDSRLSSCLNGVVTVPYTNVFRRATYVLADNNAIGPYDTADDATLSFRAYEYTPDAQDEISTYDVSVTNKLDNNELYSTQDTTYANGLFYGNRLSKLSVINCDGPIYIRNFFVDGSGVNLTTNYGIEVANSRNINLENCTSVRCRKAGVYINNSKVYLLRGLCSYRNYEFDSGEKRITESWSSKIFNDHSMTLSGYSSEDTAAGLLIVNSEVEVSSTSAHEYAALWSEPNLAALQVLGDGFRLLWGTNYMFNFSRNANGVVLINSKLFCGANLDYNLTATNDPSLAQINLCCELNMENGIKMFNSVLDWTGRLVLESNNNGINAEGSYLYLDRLLARNTQRDALKAVNSNVVYNKNLTLYSTEYTGSYRAFDYVNNGRHIVLENSKYHPKYASGMPSLYGEHLMSGPHGVTHIVQGDVLGYGFLPPVSINNNSDAIFVHANASRDANYANSNQITYGGLFAAVGNSRLTLKGTKEHATLVVGPNTYELQKGMAGVYAGKNSTVDIHGPTVIANFAVDCLAEDNSVINITPHINRESNTLEISSFSLTDKENHTAVELHSTRACLVANKNSAINMKDLGDYNIQWSAGPLGLNALLSGVDYPTDSYDYSQHVSAGYIQFFPNPNDSLAYPPGVEDAALSQTTRLATPTRDFGTNVDGELFYLLERDIANDFSSITAGGVCVRAVNNSIVNVQNVHFPCGHWNPSSIIYQASDTGLSDELCNRLFIWNIADNSQLHAALLSVSGKFPADVGYYGPRGIWLSGAGSVAYGAPSSTPDTSSLSVLDYYGSSTGNPFGKSDFDNLGPFRLYFSVDPVVNYLVDLSQITWGWAPQVYAQGYQFSGNMRGDSASALYTSILQRNQSGSIVASGFYYGSSIVDNPGHIRVFLDESGSDTFANAKHCSVGKSGLTKLVSIYLPYTDVVGGESASDSVKNAGFGYKSSNIFDLSRDN